LKQIIILFTRGCHQIIYYLIVDWRAAVPRSDGVGPTYVQGSTQRLSNCPLKFYEELKSSASAGFGSRNDDCQDFSFDNYIPADSKDEAGVRLKSICNSIDQSKRKRLESYAVLGTELTNLKYRYTEKKCHRCIGSENMYEVINCCKCTRSNDIKFFFNYAKSVTNFSRDYVTFYITISKLCRNYPKLMYASVSMNDLKKYLMHISAEMKKDRILACCS